LRDVGGDVSGEEIIENRFDKSREFIVIEIPVGCGWRERERERERERDRMV
jgi:hypothetical protein